MCMYHILHFFIHSFVHGHLDCFHTLAILSNAAVNMGVQIRLWDNDFFCPLGVYPEVGMLIHMVVLFLISWGTSILFPEVAIPVYIPTNSVQSFSFLQSLPEFYISCLFDNNHFNRCEVISHCGFDLHSPHN